MLVGIVQSYAAMRRSMVVLAAALLPLVVWAKDEPKQILNWPDDAHPILRFTIGKIQKVGAFSGQNTFIIDTAVQNLSSRPISHATFNFYMYDKSKARIGDGYLDIRNVAAGETIKIKVNASTAGTPVSLSVAPNSLPAELASYAPPKTVSLTVYSVPSGARLKVDGKDSGVTPTAITVAVGSHMLQFSKEGYNTGTFPLVITPDQLSGGTVSYELGSSAHDTLELRDGTVLTVDLESVSATSVTVRIAGNVQTIDRNQVKRILLTQREPAH
ncbi:MAG: PEGA domain-containing protein [Acidobacteriales bacterium]|nr:PEGA domain-containing protein [Terriglobales bacterium]